MHKKFVLSSKQCIVFALIASFLLSVITGNLQILRTRAATGQTYHIDGNEWNNSLDLYDMGYVRDFTLNGGNPLVLNDPYSESDTFSVQFNLPKKLLNGTLFDPQFYLVPATGEDPQEAFLKNIRLEKQAQANDMHSFWYTSQSTVFDGGQVSFSTDSAYFQWHEMFYVDENLNDVYAMSGDVPPTGTFYLVCLFFDTDIVGYSSGATMPASFFIAEDPVYIDNPAQPASEGSFIPEESTPKGKKVTLDVSVYAEDTLLTSVEVIAYSARGSCIGYAPCTAYAGEEITLNITPTGWDRDYKYDYYFPSRRNGSAYPVTVPEDGHVDVYLTPLMHDLSLSGYVYDSDGASIPGAVVSVSAAGDADLAFSAQTDSAGYYRIENITTTGNLTASVSKAGCVTEEYIFPEDIITGGAALTHDFVLEQKAVGFTVKITGNADSELLYAITSRCESSNWADVYSSSGDAVNGCFAKISADTLRFYPDTKADIAADYTLTVNSMLFKDTLVPVEFGGEVALTLGTVSGIKAQVSGGDLSGYNHLCGFGTSGATLFNDTGKASDLLEIFTLSGAEETLNILGYSSEVEMGPVAAHINDLPDTLLSTAYTRDVKVSTGSITDLGNITLPFLSSSSRMLDTSYFSASSHVTKVGDTIDVTGRIDSSRYEYEISALRIYGWKAASYDGFAVLTARYKENSLVIDGKPAKASFYNGSDYRTLGRQIILSEQVSGPIDFSCKLEATDATDMQIVVEADIVVAGNAYEKQLIGTWDVSGVPVSLKTASKTATGIVKCSGIALPDTSVNVWCGNTLMGKTTSDQFGSWELRAQIPVDPAFSRSYRLHATSGGYSTRDCIVLYDPNAAAAEQIYLTENGAAQSDSYVWTSTGSYAFEAVIDNPSAVKEDASFYVMCSDGSVLSLNAHAGKSLPDAGSVPRQVFSSDSYSFGEKGLVPVKVWFSYSAGNASDIKIPERAPLYSGDSDHYDTGHVYAEGEASSLSLDRVPAASELGNGTALTTITAQVDADEFASMLGADSKQMRLYGDDHKDLYDIVITGDEEKYSIGIHDEQSGTYYRLDTFIYEADEIPQILSTLSDLRSEHGISEPEIATMGIIPCDAASYVTGANDIAGIISQMLDPSGASEYTLEAGVRQLLLSSPKTARFAFVTKYVGISDLVNIWSSCSIAYETRQKSNTIADDLKMLSFLEKYETLLDGDADVTKAKNAASQAKTDLERAISEQKEYLAMSMELGIADFVISNTSGPLGKSVSLVLSPVKNAMQDAIKALGCDATWAYAQESVGEAKLAFLKATGINHEKLKEIFQQAEEGNFTDEAILKMIKDSMKDEDDEEEESSGGDEEEDDVPGDENDGCEDDGVAVSEDSEDFVPVIDPSGYVYEAVASNRIEGAVVTLYSEGMELFEAERYGQKNPIISDAEGKYAWDVPEGNWFVQVTHPDYEDASSQYDPAATVTIDGVNYLPVLPPQLDVNIPVINMDMPNALICSVEGTLYLVFDKYMQVDTISGGVTVNGAGEASITLIPVDAEVSPAHTPICGGMNLASVYRLDGAISANISNLNDVTATITDQVLGYNGVSAAQTAQFDPSYVPKKAFGASSGSVAPADTGSSKTLQEEKESGSPVIPIAAGAAVLLIGGGAGAYFYRKKKNAVK